MKRKNSPSRLLDTRRHFDYISPVGIEHCGAQLMMFNERETKSRFINQRNRKVTVKKVKSGLYACELEESGGVFHSFVELQRMGASQTRVIGYVDVHSEVIVPIIIVFSVAI